mmetsp:Transcript_49230/g.74895  ORF Transcript_49230/g.74895 Transcript_49230/m.74895 type:complete len:81 (-) Transcript_49230:205-447(-)
MMMTPLVPCGNHDSNVYASLHWCYDHGDGASSTLDSTLGVRSCEGGTRMVPRWVPEDDIDEASASTFSRCDAPKMFWTTS